MYGIGDGIAQAFVLLMWLCAIFVPLGAWKLIDIAIWACRHISVSVGFG